MVRREQRRDRHGRGLRGPLASRGPLTPHGAPLGRTRAERFDEIVLDAVERVEQRFPTELHDVEFAVEDVPTIGQAADGVPLGATVTDDSSREAARVVIFRRPIEQRCASTDDLAALVRDVLVEQVADLLDLIPEEVDPDYGEF